MFKITGTQVSFRVSTAEAQVINDVLQRFQESENIEFTSTKNAMTHVFSAFSMVSEAENTETKQNELTENQRNLIENGVVLLPGEQVIVVDTELQQAVDMIKTEIGYETEPTLSQLLADCIEIATTPVTVPEPVEVEKVVEVEKPLSANQVIISMSAAQHDLIKKIARWRSSVKMDPQTMTDETVIKRLAFNTGSLLNYGEEFETGLSSKKIKS